MRRKFRVGILTKDDRYNEGFVFCTIPNDSKYPTVIAMGELLNTDGTYITIMNGDCDPDDLIAIKESEIVTVRMAPEETESKKDENTSD